MKEGDIVRVRVLNSGREWCVCHVVLHSPNGKSLGLWTDDALEFGDGALLLGFIPVLIEGDSAYLVGFGVELEIERQVVQ